MPRPFPHPHPQVGFSLLELSAVLAIIAVLTAGTLSMGSSVIESARRANTNNKLDAIEKALLAFRLANNRLPCPSDATQTDTPAFSVTYGYEAGSNAANNPLNSCIGGSPAANFSYTLPTPPANSNVPGGTIIAEGTVPVKALGLSDEYQWDGWGHKFAYAVWTPLTAVNAFTSYGVNPNCGAITVQNAGGGNRTTSGAYALVSFGSNGHGGYLKNGTRYFMGTENNAAEKSNCHCTATADAGNYAASYVQQDVTQSNPADPYSVFDDIVRFKDRWQMQNAYDTYSPKGLPCWPGFQMQGVASGDRAGYSVAVADVNGDGIPDLIIGAPDASPGGASNAGSVFVVFGSTSGFPDPLPLSNLDGSNGLRLDGAAASTEAGYAVAAADINGDGIPDLIIGAPYANSNAGSVYVVFGKSSGWSSCSSSSPCVLQAGAGSFLNGTNGVQFNGATPSIKAGWSVAGGDVNGDGIPDLIIGAPNVNSNAGSIFVVFGSTSGWSATTSLNASILNGTNGVEFDGSAGSWAGAALATGDINGDKIVDIIVGAWDASPGGVTQAGSAFVVFGKPSGWASCTSSSPCILKAGASNFLNGSNGVEFDGTAIGDFTGYSVAAGDINGDGISDLLIGAPLASPGGNTYEGKVYVVFGKASAWPSTATPLNNSILNGASGVEFDGPGPNQYVGDSIAAGDINGDGIPDLIIGASDASATYAVFGNKSGGPSCGSSSPCILRSGAGNFLDGSNGIEFDGIFNSAGESVAVGDINGDGIADLLIGDPDAGPGGNLGAGEVYIYFGHKTTTLDPWPTSAFSLNGL